MNKTTTQATISSPLEDIDILTKLYTKLSLFSLSYSIFVVFICNFIVNISKTTHKSHYGLFKNF